MNHKDYNENRYKEDYVFWKVITRMMIAIYAVLALAAHKIR